MSEEKLETLGKRLSLTKDMLRKKRTEVPTEARKADSELRRLKKIVRRVANKKRNLAGNADVASAKES